MRFAYVAIFALVACGRSPAAASELTLPSPSFEPTAFSVEVRGTGRPVILIPGLGCPGTVWQGVVEHLHGYETHTLALAGFAGQPRIDAPLVESTVDQLAQYIAAHHLASPIVIGHSLGGTIAYRLAARLGTEIGPTIVVDAGASDGTDTGSAAQVRDMWRGASDDQFAAQVRDIFGQMARRPERLRPLIPSIARSDRRAIGDAIYELATTNVRGELDAIRAPVLLVLADGGLKDGFRRQGQAVRDREVVVVPNAGHFVMLDDPDAFNAAVDGFLARRAPREAVAAN